MQPAELTEEDLVFEEELLRAPFQLRLWWRYIEARKDATTAKRHLLYERALRALPGSYKLWHAYLSERLEAARGQPVSSAAFDALNNTFERALVTMHKMPRIWELFLRALLEQRLVTRTRRACDRALAALPVTQHERVWTTYLVRARGVPGGLGLRPNLKARAERTHDARSPRRRLRDRRECPWRRRSGAPPAARGCWRAPVRRPPPTDAVARSCILWRAQGVSPLPEARAWPRGGVHRVPQEPQPVERGGAAAGGRGERRPVRGARRRVPAGGRGA
jgi:hypothetical protein